MSNILSVVLKVIVVVGSAAGVGSCFRSSEGSFMGNRNALRYFTILSNIWIGVLCLAELLFLLRGGTAARWQAVCKLVFTVSITLTGFVFCFVLAPTKGRDVWNRVNVLTHVVVPLAAAADYFVCGLAPLLSGGDALWCTLPPLAYLAYASLGYRNGWDFGDGRRYPYFFLDWGSEAGAFGFSRKLPFLGVVYWVILIALFVLGVAAGYIRLGN